MKARFSKLTLVTVALLTLTACSQSQSTSSKSSAKEETKQTQTKSSKEMSSAKNPSKETGKEESSKAGKSDVKVDSGVSYNGSYYSVKGKYGEVMIANKHYPLAPDFNPGEDPEAVSALHELIAAMQAEGYPISDQYSGFSSYDTQVGLYQNYVNQDGQEAADRYSARPGYSEHQTGLTFDLIDTSGNLVTEPGPSKWLLKNAAKYGFVVRYQEGKEKVTGYMPESWHLRYIGKEAQDIADSGLSLEEYYGFTGGDYVDK